MRRGLAATIAGGVMLAVAFGGQALGARGPGADQMGRLPLKGTAPSGQRYELRTRRRPRTPATSWCLTLRYAGDIDLIDSKGKRRFSEGAGTCGPSPAPPVSGEIIVDCESGGVFIFGGATTRAGPVALVTSHGRHVPARRARVPEGSGYRGTVFLITAPVSDLPAYLVSAGRGRVPGTQFPRRSKACRPLPGSPEGGQPFADFP